MYNTWAYQRIVPLLSIEFIQSLSDKDGHNVDPLAFGLPPDFPRDRRCLVTFKILEVCKTEMTVTGFDWTVRQMMRLAETGLNQCLDKVAASFATFWAHAYRQSYSSFNDLSISSRSASRGSRPSRRIANTWRVMGISTDSRPESSVAA